MDFRESARYYIMELLVGLSKRSYKEIIHTQNKKHIILQPYDQKT